MGTAKMSSAIGAKTPAAPINAAIPMAMDDAGALPATPIIVDPRKETELSRSSLLTG